MACYKDCSYKQGIMAPISFEKQINPGSFEYALHYIIGNDLGISVFNGNYTNDATVAPAFDTLWGETAYCTPRFQTY